MTKTRRIRKWRRVAEASQAVVIAGLPFLEIKGESALRFDVPTLRLHFFGTSLWMEEFFIVLVAVILMLLVVILVTMVFGRIWCGWMCPQTVLGDITSFIARAKGRSLFYRSSAYSFTLFVSVLAAANLIWYFVSPYEFFPDLILGNQGHIVSGAWLLLTVLIFLNLLLLRQRFCATVCPYAKLQGTLFNDKTMAVSFDARRRDECVDCLACVKICPVGIDIRNGPDSACIECAECRDSCAAVMEQRGKRSLVGYFFGRPGGAAKSGPHVLIAGLAAASFLLFFLYIVYVRQPVDMTVLPNYSFKPRINGHGKIINSYVLSIKNRGRNYEELSVDVNRPGVEISVLPRREVRLDAGEMKKVEVFVFMDGAGNGRNSTAIDIIIKSLEKGERIISREADFIIPGEK